MDSNKNNNHIPIPELLAPAGTLDAALAAFDAGADAVYAGLPRFNARERGRNFSYEDMARLLGHARVTGKRVYVTLNTLIKEGEIADAAEVLKELLLLRPDAVIVQDLGLIRMLRTYFPELPIHASTQMGIHNSAGMNMLKRMGVERVILERQVTIDELRLIKERAELELEIFIHGALCCSRSGQCLFSSWLGGWSGNRGKCKQPCRRRFFSDNGNGFFFSTNDLCLIDLIPEIRKLQPASLKIEGRLRSPDYVSKVVRAYRMVLDASPENEKDALSQARQLLAASYGRKWSHGFWRKENFVELIEHKSLGSSGRLCGTVIRRSQGGFFADLKEPVAIGDSIRIQPKAGTEGPALQIRRLAIDRKTVKRAFPGKRCFVFCDKEVSEDGLIFKIGNSSANFTERIQKLSVPQAAVDLEVKVAESGLVVSIPAAAVQWQKEQLIERARSHALEAAQIEDAFRRGAPDQLMIAQVKVDVEADLFLPSSVLKQLRREFWDWAEQHVCLGKIRENANLRLQNFLVDLEKPMPGLKAAALKTVFADDHDENVGKQENGILARRLFAEDDLSADEWVLPEFCPETELENVRAKLVARVSEGAKRFRITSLYQLELFAKLKHQDFILTASFPLPITNRFAVAELLSWQVERCTAWVELERQALEELEAAAPGRIERFTYGRLPLLNTRARVPASGEITDARGKHFYIREDSNLVIVLTEKIMKIPPAGEGSCFLDLRYVDDDSAKLSDFNYRHALI